MALEFEELLLLYDEELEYSAPFDLLPYLYPLVDPRSFAPVTLYG